MLASLFIALCSAAPPAGPAPDESAADAPLEASAEAESPADEAVWSDPLEASTTEGDSPREPAATEVRPFEMTTAAAELESDAGVTPSPTVTRQARVRPDRPIRWRIDLQLDGGTHSIRHGSFQAYSVDRNLAGMGAGVRVDFRLASSPVFLGGGAAYRRYGSSRFAYDLLEQDLMVQEALVFLRVSVQALEGVDVYLEPGGGPTIVDLETWSSRRAEQRAVTGMFNGLAGVALYLPKAWLPKKGAARVTGGFDLGLGYGWRAPITVQPNPDTDDEPLATSSVRFGDLALRGFIWRAGLFIRFM